MVIWLPPMTLKDKIKCRICRIFGIRIVDANFTWWLENKYLPDYYPHRILRLIKHKLTYWRYISLPAGCEDCWCSICGVCLKYLRSCKNVVRDCYDN